MSDYQRKGKKYSKITYKKRMLLINMIVDKGAKITETSKKLHVKLPTAKAILSSYRKKNHIFQRKIEQEAFEEYCQGGDETKQKGVKIENESVKNDEKVEKVEEELKNEWKPFAPYDFFQIQQYYSQMNWWSLMYGQSNYFFC